MFISLIKKMINSWIVRWNTTKDHIIDRYNEFLEHKMSPEDALYIIRIMFELNYRGFEWYISAYFHEVHKYTTKVIGWLNDKWIDIIWSKTIWHQELNLAAQCKKWYFTHENIKKKDILDFWDNAKHRKEGKPNPKFYFVTTTNASKEAKRVAKEYSIELKDCRDLIKMRNRYSLDDFKNDSRKWKNKGEWWLTDKNPVAVIQNYLNEKKWLKYRSFEHQLAH